MTTYTKPVALSFTEIVEFLIRHPLTAVQVTETEAMLKSGMYEFDVTSWNWPGVIPPWGLAVDDNAFGKFGTVVIFPARDFTLRYTGYVDPNVGGQIQLDPYEPPPFTRGPMDDILDAGKTALSIAALFAIGYALSQVNSRKR